MDDRSIVRPIIDALDYFNNCLEETNYFYDIIDKFCAYWFGGNINIDKLSNVELLLMHELLGEYLRFEENNKRVALWILAINRVCYNYSRDLSYLVSEFDKINEDESLDIDETLIDSILKQIKTFSELHNKAGKSKDLGHSDIISNYLQWVMVYTGFIYPSLNDKSDFHDTAVVKSMNFILMEFIKQRSNDKRMAYLLLGIIQACNQYNLQNENFSKEFIESYEDKDIVFAGQDEALVKELLERLRDENAKQSNGNGMLVDMLPLDYIKSKIDKMFYDFKSDRSLVISIFNKYVLKFTSKFLSYPNEYQETFINELSGLSSSIFENIGSDITDKLKKAIQILPETTRKWLTVELTRYRKNKPEYIEKFIKDFFSKEQSVRFNYTKPFMLLFLSDKFDII